MVQELLLKQGNKVNFILHRKRFSRTLRIKISSEGSISITAPYLASEERIQSFIYSKLGWIESTLEVLKSYKSLPIPLRSKNHYLEFKSRAKDLTIERLIYFNQFYKLTCKDVRIRQTRTRWGSCSATHNLNFNYKIYFLPKELQDYLIVHELCHIKEFNHSKNFWREVEKTIPDWKIRRLELKKYIL